MKIPIILDKDEKGQPKDFRKYLEGSDSALFINGNNGKFIMIINTGDELKIKGNLKKLGKEILKDEDDNLYEQSFPGYKANKYLNAVMS